MRRVSRPAVLGTLLSVIAVGTLLSGAGPSASSSAAYEPSTQARPAAAPDPSFLRTARPNRGNDRPDLATRQSTPATERAEDLARQAKSIAASAAKAERAKKAAEKKAAEKKAAAKAKLVAKLGYDPDKVDSPQGVARAVMANKYGWGSGQYSCFNNVVMSESKWSVSATNPSSGAYGIMQALPGSKMASAGSDWRTNPATQIRWGLDYIHRVYGTPCSAWSFHLSHGWY